jgi:protein-disulfide isomerase
MTFSKDTVYGIVIAVLACLLVISVFTQGFGLVKSAVPQVTQQPANTPPANSTMQQPSNTAPAATVKTMELPPSLSMAPVMGTPNSPVALLEFSDFQCPYCGMAFGSPWTSNPQYAGDIETPILGVIPKFEAAYVSNGQADFIHVPVAFLDANDGTNESRDSADAALCANAQGKYFAMYDAIFNAQTPNEGSEKYSKPNLEIIAQNVSGLNQTAFDACLAADTYVNQVEEFTNDWEMASEANTGSAGTPTVWLLADASKFTPAKISAAAAASGAQWGITSDNSTYVIIVGPGYSQIQAAMSVLG